MRKTMEQIVIEGQAARCGSLEELYLLWQMMQQMEEEPFGSTCYEEIDPRPCRWSPMSGETCGQAGARRGKWSTCLI